MKVVGIVSAGYMPGLEFFQMMHIVDELYIDDEGGYNRNSRHDGNCIRTDDGITWLRVPVVQGARTLPEASLDNDRPWRWQHLELVKRSYHNSQYFNDLYPGLEEWLSVDHRSLTGLNIALIEHFFKPNLDLETPTRRTSTVDYARDEKDRSVRLLSFLRAVGADTIVIFDGAMRWLDEGVLATGGITVRWFHPEVQVYIQLHPGFDPRVSILDMMFSLGPSAAYMVRKVEWYDHEVLEDRQEVV